LKVTGRALYAGDRQIEDLAYGYLLTSAVSKGSIQAMDPRVASTRPVSRRSTPHFIRSSCSTDWNPGKER